MKLAENKTWNKFADNVALPLLEGYTFLSGIGEIGFSIKGGVKALFNKVTRTPSNNIAEFERLKAALAQEEILGAEATGSALKTDANHRAASFVVEDISIKGRFFTIKGGDGLQYNLTQLGVR